MLLERQITTTKKVVHCPAEPMHRHYRTWKQWAQRFPISKLETHAQPHLLRQKPYQRAIRMPASLYQVHLRALQIRARQYRLVCPAILLKHVLYQK